MLHMSLFRITTPLSGGKRTAIDGLYCQNMKKSTCNICTFRAGIQFGRIHHEPEKGVPVTRECQYACFFFVAKNLNVIMHNYLYRLRKLLIYRDNIDILIIW